MADLNRRSAAQTAIQRIHGELLDPNVATDKCSIEQRQASINGHFQRFLEAHQNIISEAPAGDIEPHNDLWEAVENRYNDACVIMRRLLEQPSEPKPNPFEMPTSSAMETRLDPLAIPSFDGSQHKWLAFKDTFEALVHNQSYPEAYKLGKLRMAINPDVVPLVGGLYTGGYHEVWEALKRRYDNPRQLAEIHATRFLTMECQPNESHSSLLRVVDTARESLRALTVMNLPVQSWDALTVPIVASKLPVPTQRAWSMSQSTNAIPTLEELLSFVEKRALTLASSSMRADKALPLSPSWPRQRDLACGGPRVPSKMNQALRTHTVTTTTNSCFICGSGHGVFQCEAFKSMPPATRFEKLKGSNLCFNCLKQGHAAKACPSGNCRRCNGKHNTLLCTRPGTNDDKGGSITATSTLAQHTNQSSSARIKGTLSPPRNFMTANGSSTILATACVLVTDAYGNQVRARALCDPGSQRSFVAESMANRMDLPRRRCVIAVEGIGSTATAFTKGIVNIQLASIHTGETVTELEAFIIPHITSALPTNRIDPTAWPHLPNNHLADPAFHIPGAIDMLLGADIWGDLIQGSVIHGAKHEPHAQSTRFGWVVFGRAINDHLSPDRVMAHTALSAPEERLDTLLQQFWSWEEVHSPSQSGDLDQCEQIFQRTNYRNATGQYVVQIPFDSQAVPLGDSFSLARQQFLRLERKLGSDPELRQKYVDFMREYQALGDMQPAIDELPSQSYFIPHHAVSSKFRVVFNASAKTSNGISLNDVQLIGPMLQDLLIDIVLRFRRYKVPVTADVEKMFRRVRMAEGHWRWQRILWRESPDQPLQIMELRTVTYGMASSSYNAVRALQQCAEDNHVMIQHPERAQRARESILKDFYMDDLLTSVDNAQQAIELASDVQHILQAGGFRLRKWNSSDPTVLSAITEQELPREELTIDRSEATILGLRWQPPTDTLTYKVAELHPNVMPTKRTVISEVARLYDPTGMLAPVILVAKKLIQELWLAGLHWDAPLPADLRNSWLEFRAALPQLNRIEVPRWLGMCGSIESSLHGFSDASLKAYAAVVYVRTIDERGRISVALVAAKTKVAPIKQQTVPRLELAAAQLLVKLVNQVKIALGVPSLQYKLYTDSSIVLGWIRQHPSTLKPYVANRVSHIQQNSDPLAWRHIRSVSNPADCASRGLSASQLPTYQLWWAGPPFLHVEPEPPIVSNSSLTEEEIGILQTEVRTGPISCIATCKTIELTTRRAIDGIEVSLLERFSNLSKLLHTTAYIMRWHPARKEFWHHPTITAGNLEEALAWHIKAEQAQHFATEIRQLRKASNVAPSSCLTPLNPFLDDQGILRVGGRLLLAEIAEDQRHPIILPRTSTLTKLLVLHTHQETLHGGVQLTLHTLRRNYWVTQARRAIKACLHNCVVCQRHRKQVMIQQMASLPRHRVSGHRPFAASGVDYCGPFLIRVGGTKSRTVVKTYAVIFVCMATKAVHIELAEDLSAMAFLHVFSRFIGRRGPCKDLYSDNGTAFVGAKRIMHDDLREWERESNRQHLADGGTNWHFITPSAPHQGGLWEAAVKAAKRHLLKVMGTQTMRYEDLHTLLIRVEACLNSRPLIALSDDPDDKLALSPSDFLIGAALVATPEPTIGSEIPTNRLKQWEYLRRLHQTFWRRWNDEYLSTLQTRSKWQTPEGNIKVGDVVLVRNENLPPTHWRLGRVIAVHPGRDALIRNVTIRHAAGEMQRPVQKLCRLPIEAVSSPETTVPAGEDVQEPTCSVGAPQESPCRLGPNQTTWHHR